MGISAALAVAGLVAATAWRGGAVAALALGLAWLASVPVLDWAPTLKPDALAVALTAAAVVGSSRRPALAGALLVAAALVKPTALLPAAALAVWLLRTDPRALRRLLVGAAPAAVAGAALCAALGAGDVWRHVVAWNALSWDAARASLLGLVALATLGAPFALALPRLRGAPGAYLAGALGVLALGGREGATLNYLLDLDAAVLLVLASSLARPAPVARRAPVLGLLVALQLVVGTVLLDPFGLTGGGAGHWGDPQRLAVLRGVLDPARPALVEDSGLQIALGGRPAVDDLFLWSRLVERGQVDPGPVLDAVRGGRFALVVAEADLANLEAPGVPSYERARWAPALVAAVRDRYVLERSAGGLWLYRPRAEAVPLH